MNETLSTSKRGTIESLREEVGTVRRLLLGLRKADIDFEKTVRQLCRVDARAWHVAFAVKSWKVNAADADLAISTLQSIKRAAEEMYQRRGKVQKWLSEKGFGFIMLGDEKPDADNNNTIFLPRSALCVELLRLAGSDEPLEPVDLYSDFGPAGKPYYTWPTVFIEWEDHEKGKRATRLTCGKCYGAVIGAPAAEDGDSDG